MAELITKNMTVGEIIEKYPNVVDVLQSFGLTCVGCSVNPYETLEQGTIGHGMDQETLDAMLKEANEYVAKHGSGEPNKNKSNHVEKARVEGDPVIVTENAAVKVKEFMEKQSRQGEGLRLSVQPGGCAGFTYGLEFSKEPNQDEVVLEQHGVKVFVDKTVANEIAGLVIDYVDSLQGSGFKISNPNATSSCGCGKSFR